MTLLEKWLQQATRRLSKDSVSLVRTEIAAHYESALETAFSCGLAGAEAERAAMASLGDALTANREYRRVLLTSEEARMLRESNWEARVVCSHSWLRWMLQAMPAALVSGAAAFSFSGDTGWARVLLAAGVVMALVFGAPFLPIYTRSRSRIYRGVKWVILPGALFLAFAPQGFRLSWLLVCCLWLLVKFETTRMSIRRKLPMDRWPKQLYL